MKRCRRTAESTEKYVAGTLDAKCQSDMSFNSLNLNHAGCDAQEKEKKSLHGYFNSDSFANVIRPK